MVKVREEQPVKEDGTVDINLWIERLAEIHPFDQQGRKELQKACSTVQNLLNDSGPSDYWREDANFFVTGLEMAQILADLQLDTESLVAAVLYRSVREQRLSIDRVYDSFGDIVGKLISGVLRMDAITPAVNNSEDNVLGLQSQEQSENIRKMLVALIDDVRIALIKIAERTCVIRDVKMASHDDRIRVAREVSDVYAPLAHRLGIGQLKWELEDIAFRYLEPDAYKSIAKLLDERRLDRQDYITSVIDQINSELETVGIRAEVSGRAKHIYSIWRKMQRKDIGFSQVYDIRAIRVLVPSVRDCYGVLGIVHTLWRNIPNEFDDYIASPKENGYKSLHTAVIGPDRKVIEVQIRTHAMHEEAEFGVCAHWLYKGTDDAESANSYDQKIDWLRQVLEWHEELGGSPLEDDLVAGIEQDRIYIFTPDGHVIDLPSGSTPLDFAYRVHTEVGHSCRGAKVNNRIVPLNHRLQTADQVEIITGKRDAPSRDWLSPALGYLKTSRARAKVQHWFKLQARDQHIADGRAILDKEFSRLAVSELDYEELAQKLNLKTLDDLYAAVGASDLGVGQVINVAQKLIAVDNYVEPVITTVGRATREQADTDLYIDGVGNLLTNIAGCCNPVPGDAIIGYITVGRGVSIHRQDCPNILQLQSDEPERIIQVAWGEAPQSLYPVDIFIEAFDRHGLLRDITALLDRERINISAMQTLSDKRKNTVDMQVTIEIKGFDELSRVLSKLNQLPNISYASRKLGSPSEQVNDG